MHLHPYDLPTSVFSDLDVGRAITVAPDLTGVVLYHRQRGRLRLAAFPREAVLRRLGASAFRRLRRRDAYDICRALAPRPTLRQRATRASWTAEDLLFSILDLVDDVRTRLRHAR